jgi:large repetitive protein
MRSVLAALFLIAFGANAGTVTTLDEAHPLVILGQDPVIALAESPRGAHVEFEVFAYGGRDPNPVVRCDPPSGSLFPFGPSHVQCVATNNFGERASGGVYIYVYDGTEPVLDLPDDIVVETDSDSAVVEFEASASDAVDGPVPVTCAPASGTRFPLGSTWVECSAIDAYGNAAIGVFAVTVKDEDEEPVLFIQVSATIQTEATEPAGASVEFEVTTTGSTDPNPDVTCDPASGSMFAIGTTTVLCIATDSFGNHAEGTFEVIVTDTTAPVISGLADIEVEATSSSGAVVTFSPTANDAIEGSVEVTCTPASGSEFPVGQTNVQCTASDSRGNTADGGFVVTVRESGGGPVLFIQVPSTIEAEATSADGASVEFEVTTTGSTDPDPSVTCSPASGSTFALGTTTVLCVATDSYGNRAEGSFDVVVGDSVAPMIVSISATPNLLAPANHKLVDVAATVDATDSVDPMPQCYAYYVTANEAVDAPGSGNTDFDWILTGPLTMQLRAERSGEGDDRIYYVHVRCSDSSGNDTTSSVEVRVPKAASGDDATIDTPKRRRSVGRR